MKIFEYLPIILGSIPFILILLLYVNITATFIKQKKECNKIYKEGTKCIGKVIGWKDDYGKMYTDPVSDGTVNVDEVDTYFTTLVVECEDKYGFARTVEVDVPSVSDETLVSKEYPLDSYISFMSLGEDTALCEKIIEDCQGGN